MHTAAYNEVVVCDRRRRKNVRSTFFVSTNEIFVHSVKEQSAIYKKRAKRHKKNEKSIKTKCWGLRIIEINMGGFMEGGKMRIRKPNNLLRPKEERYEEKEIGEMA